MEEEKNEGSSSTLTKLSINRKRQEGNPLLKYVRNIPFEWADIKADFEAGKEMGILYLSLKWHKLHPGYIEGRMDSDGSGYTIKVLLVLVNVDPRFMLRELNLYCYRSDWTLILCYSPEEAAEYLEHLTVSRSKDEQTAVTAFQEKKRKRLGITNGTEADNGSLTQMRKAIEFLSGIRTVTTSDAQRLIGTFGSIRAIANADVESLSLCPGLGPIKAENVHRFFRTPFLRT